MAITNRERIGNGLDHLARGLRPFVEREMKSSAGDHWLSPSGCRASRPTPSSLGTPLGVQGLLVFPLFGLFSSL